MLMTVSLWSTKHSWILYMVSWSVIKRYISKNLFQRLFVDGIQLITKLKTNLKGALMNVSDRLLLRKRTIIETVNDELKNIAQVEHSGHRYFDNFIVNLLGAIAAYCLFPKKPCINVQRIIDTQLALFWIRRTHVKIGVLYNEAVKVLNTYSVATAQRTLGKLETYSQILIRLQQ